MSRARRAVAVFVVAAAVIATIALWRRTSSEGGGSAASAGESRDQAAKKAFRYAWPRGTAYAYTVRWKGDSRVTLPGQDDAPPFVATYEIDGDLMLRSLGRKGAATLLAAELQRVGNHVFRALGRDLVPSDEDAARELVHHTAWLEMTPDGVVRTVWLRKNDGDAWKIVAQSLFGHLTVTIPDVDTAEWVASEPTSNGRAATTYAWTTDAGPLALKRARSRYDQLAMVPSGACEGCRQDVHGNAEIRLDPAGHVRTIDDDETLTVLRASTTPGSGIDVRAHEAFDLALTSVTKFDAPTDFELDLANLEARHPGVPAVSGDVESALLEQRVAGLTWDQLQTGIVVAALRGAPERGLVSHASALVVQHPENAARLAALFVEPTTKPRARALIVDILTSAGTPEAQAAMRDALGSDIAKRDPDYKLLIQRFTLLPHPDSKSVELVSSTYDASRARGDDELRFASATALGAMAGELGRQGDDAAARRYDARLVADLGRARSAKEKAVLVGAVGGEGRKENVKLLASYAQDADATVRAAVAGGLRTTDSPEVRNVLFDLLGDSDDVVKQSALSSLDQRPISGDDVRRLREATRGGGVGTDLDAALVGFLAKHANAGPDVRTTLLAILARTTDPELQARIRYVLGQLPSP